MYSHVASPRLPQPMPVPARVDETGLFPGRHRTPMVDTEIDVEMEKQM